MSGPTKLSQSYSEVNTEKLTKVKQILSQQIGPTESIETNKRKEKQKKKKRREQREEIKPGKITHGKMKA